MIPGLEVAQLRLNYASQDQHLRMDIPPWHTGFNKNNKMTEAQETSVFCNEITFQLQNCYLTRHLTWQRLICQNKIWELWEDKQGQFVLYNPMQLLLRKLVVDPDFQTVNLCGDFSDNELNKIYPLPQDLEIVFFANWLGKFGDLILHASGIAVDGKGYAFAGFSGVGKSTLARKLSHDESVTILGEDQLVLRYLDDRFWLFGTPWHEDLRMRSPMGVPLKKIFFLEQSGENAMRQATRLEGITRLLQTAFIPYYRPELVKRILERLELLAESVPMWWLSYELGDDVMDRILSA